jgi:hypothetical protein
VEVELLVLSIALGPSFLVWLEVLWLEDNNKNSLELEASLAPAEVEVGAAAKADQ